MEHHLLQRCYTKGYIRDAITKASSISRENALVDKTNDNQLTRVPFVVTYNPKLPSLPKILKERQSILHSLERCSTVFLSSATKGQGTLAICYVANVLHLTPLQSQIETMTPAAATTITLIKVPLPIKTTRVMRATTEMNALNVGVHLEIQKAY